MPFALVQAGLVHLLSVPGRKVFCPQRGNGALLGEGGRPGVQNAEDLPYTLGFLLLGQARPLETYRLHSVTALVIPGKDLRSWPLPLGVDRIGGEGQVREEREEREGRCSDRWELALG